MVVPNQALQVLPSVGPGQVPAGAWVGSRIVLSPQGNVHNFPDVGVLLSLELLNKGPNGAVSRQRHCQCCVKALGGVARQGFVLLNRVVLVPQSGETLGPFGSPSSSLRHQYKFSQHTPATPPQPLHPLRTPASIQ